MEYCKTAFGNILIIITGFLKPDILISAEFADFLPKILTVNKIKQFNGDVLNALMLSHFSSQFQT